METTRSHQPLASSFPPLWWRSGIKIFCTEAQSAGPGTKLADDPIQRFPTLPCQWNLLGSMLKNRDSCASLARIFGSEYLQVGLGICIFTPLPGGPAGGGALSSSVEPPSECRGTPPGQEADEKSRRTLAQGRMARQ